ncbi:MAG: SdpI family protein [Oscillospiraceae bacterium]|nr:SdpI family protein [Oscillospiraceae bacterium]
MKKLYTILYAVMLLCVLGTVVFLLLLPDRVPMHYNLAGEVDRMGSKYESALWPLLSLSLGGLFLWMARRERTRRAGSNEKVLLLVGICVLLFFTLLGFWTMWKAMAYGPEAASQRFPEDLNRFVNVGLGALLTVLGNFMPKARRNSLFGLRTGWSMANDAVWQKSQRFGGITLVVAGLALMLLSLAVPGAWNILLLLLVLTLATGLSVVASYRYYRADREGREK